MAGDNRVNINNIDPDLNHYNNNNLVNFKQYSTESFVRDLNIENHSLNLFHNNARSILSETRMDNYDILFESINNPFHILVFTETWLLETNKHLCNFNGYKPEHLLRPTDGQFDFKVKGGGVSIFIKDHIEYKYRDDLSKINTRG